MKIADGTNLMDLGVTPACVWTVPAVMPWYRLFQGGNPWAMDVTLTPAQRDELREDGIVILELLTFGFEQQQTRMHYTHAHKMKVALVLQP